MIAQHRQRVVQRGAVEHRAGQQHARYAGVPLADAHIVDRLHQPGAVGGKGVAGQRAGIVEADVAGGVVGPHVHHVAAAVQERIAVFVVRDPARVFVAAPCDRRAAVRGLVQQVAAAVPQQYVHQRHAQAFGQPFELVPDFRQGLAGFVRQGLQVGVAAPGTQRSPDGALLQVGGHERTRQLAQGLAGLAPRAGDADGFESHG
ncbi:Uncharacterised protein [Bordetella pertussis]|nr:Uncharacterised protein [Bordetella pertussis]CFW67270.1 Uncharacterised protein [Bordetella pertussis]CPK46159.1 Uncharacterised protein [Bordetella pertussis]CPP53497.1 Uncharacterised protein [Bordetella pertussis]CPP53629.1 Uncharacterised protein [Bordetella pertussis]